MLLRRILLACLAAAAMGGATPAAAQEVRALQADEAVGASLAVVGNEVSDFGFTDREGRPVRLGSFRGKPLLVSFIYTGCFHACPAGTRALDQTVRALEKLLGPQAFNVVSIGFNQPADSPAAMRAFAAQHGIARPNWEFLSPPAAAVERLASEFGFRYVATAAGFEHVLQVTLLDEHGRIARQVLGDEPAADRLAPAMQQLIAGRALAPQGLAGELADRIRILCSVYDPATGTYRFDYALALEIAGGATFILSVLLYMLNEWRVRRRERRHARRFA